MRWVFALLICSCPAVASADIAPPSEIVPLYGAPGPRKVRGVEGAPWREVPRPVGTTLLVEEPGPEPGEPGEARVPPDPDVEVVSRDVRIDVYSGLVAIRERTVLRSSRPVHDLRLGFVQGAGRFLGERLYDLRVRVDGRKLDVEEVRGPHPASGDSGETAPGGILRLLAVDARSTTWEWQLDVDDEATVETSYFVAPWFLSRDQRLTPAYFEDDAPAYRAAEIAYDLRLARAFRGGIGATTLTVTNHGELRVLRSRPRGARAGNVWTLRPGEEVDEVSILIGLDREAFERMCVQPRARHAQRWQRWLDRLAVARACESMPTHAAESLAEELLAAARAELLPERSVARTLLGRLALTTIDAPPPSETGEERTEWIDDDGEEPSDLDWYMECQSTGAWLGSWSPAASGRGVRTHDDDEPPYGEESSKRVNRYELDGTIERRPPPAPRLAAELTTLERFIGDWPTGRPNPFVLAHQERRRRPVWTASLSVLLLLPFGLGYLRWRLRRR